MKRLSNDHPTQWHLGMAPSDEKELLSLSDVDALYLQKLRTEH